MSARHFMQEVAERVGRLSNELARKLYLIAKSDLNNPRLTRPAKEGGYGLVIAGFITDLPREVRRIKI
jgi:maltooligosyltrehalose trehalohydrolase